MDAYEQTKKLNNHEIEEKEVLKEVKDLEDKYNSMINNWNEYSGDAQNRINELKAEIETKKKEYNYKYEQISALKKEIDEIAAKIEMKSELVQFLNDEYQKIPYEVNRNTYTNKIAEMTRKIADERKKILEYINEQTLLDESIKKINITITTVDNEFEDAIFQDAKKNEKIKGTYSAFISLRDGFNKLQKNIVDSTEMKDKLKTIENKVMDYKEKLKNYDINQLEEQINLLKKVQ